MLVVVCVLLLWSKYSELHTVLGTGKRQTSRATQREDLYRKRRQCVYWAQRKEISAAFVHKCPYRCYRCTLKKGKCFCTLAGYCLTYDGWFPQQLEEYFTATHSVFLHQIDWWALPSTRRGFSPAYRMKIGKNSDMVGKIQTWWEKFLLGNGTRSENTHKVGNIPTWSE